MCRNQRRQEVVLAINHALYVCTVYSRCTLDMNCAYCMCVLYTVCHKCAFHVWHTHVQSKFGWIETVMGKGTSSHVAVPSVNVGDLGEGQQRQQGQVEGDIHSQPIQSRYNLFQFQSTIGWGRGEKSARVPPPRLIQSCCLTLLLA